MKKHLLIVLLLPLLGACGWLNPYHEDFDCRARDDSGKCVDPMTAYADAVYLETRDNLIPPSSYIDSLGGEPHDPSGRNLYQARLYKQLAELIAEPQTPVLAPPKILRVLMLPYQTREGDLMMPRYIFVKVDEAKWVLDGGLMEPMDR
ncbi:TraV family lipoprotein [Geoalkalibacter sp.]|uniref:TraV family lipoprotein n=1 Tax=Geoalkalibacter sp. TaxID=3041440 RepID=UPI00272E9315|nr:TraV family lipoprotein [Geoalkalibacter sp.]